MRTKRVNLGHIRPSNLLKSLAIKSNKNTVRPLLVNRNSNHNTIILIRRTRTLNKDRLRRTTLPIRRDPSFERASLPIRLEEMAIKGRVRDSQTISKTTNRYFSTRSGNTVARYSIDVTVVGIHRCGLGHTWELGHHAGDCSLDCAASNDVGILCVDSCQLVANQTANLVWLERVDDVGDCVLRVGIVFLFVAGNVDVNVDVSSLGIHVIVRIGSVEEVEVWNFVRCDADQVSYETLDRTLETWESSQFAIFLVQDIEIYWRIVLADHRFDERLRGITGIDGDRLFYALAKFGLFNLVESKYNLRF
jgi:hypothetical protein